MLRARSKKPSTLVNAMKMRPALTIHTGDITHLSRAAEFDTANQLMMRSASAGELHTVPGEHDMTDGTGTEYFARFGKASDNRGYYSFDHQGVHFIGLVNVMNFKPNGLGAFGARSAGLAEERPGGAQQPAHPSWSSPICRCGPSRSRWGWGTGDAEEALSYLRRFGSVTMLNGHIHQIVQKVEGNITFHTARSTAYPQPQAGVGDGPGPLAVATDQLHHMLGITSIRVQRHHQLALTDTTLA